MYTYLCGVHMTGVVPLLVYVLLPEDEGEDALDALVYKKKIDKRWTKWYEDDVPFHQVITSPPFNFCLFYFFSLPLDPNQRIATCWIYFFCSLWEIIEFRVKSNSDDVVFPFYCFVLCTTCCLIEITFEYEMGLWDGRQEVGWYSWYHHIYVLFNKTKRFS